MLGKFVSNKQTNIGKGKGKQKKQKKPHNESSPKGLMDKKQKKHGFLKGMTKVKKIKLEEKKQFKTGLLWEQNRQKNLKKCKKITVLGYCAQSKSTEPQRNQKNKTTKTKKMTKKNLFAFWETTLFLLNFCFCQVTLSHICTAVFCSKQNKNSVFSKTQL